MIHGNYIPLKHQIQERKQASVQITLLCPHTSVMDFRVL